MNMDEVVRQEREEAIKAIGAANLPYVIDGNTGDLMNSHLDTVADFFYHEEDIHLCANAPTWLRNALERERLLIEEREQDKVELNTAYDALDKLRSEYNILDEDAAKDYDKLKNMESKVAEQDKEIQLYKKGIEKIIFGHPTASMTDKLKKLLKQ